MDNRSLNRRSFIQKSSLIGAGFSLGTTVHIRDAKRTDPWNQPDRFVGPVYFYDSANAPSDLFGDLCLIRKGNPNMTMGSGTTTIKEIDSVDDWEFKAKLLRELFLGTLGTAPLKINCDLSISVDKEVVYDNIVERHISYFLSPGERVTSIMLIPKDVKFPCPALLTIHPTTEYGKAQTIGRGEMINNSLTEKSYNRAYGLHLARRGYITFSPDLLGAGDRIFSGKKAFDNQPFILSNPEWSGVGKDLWDLQRAVDVMQFFPEIDTSRIGSIGHSQGAGLTCMLLAIDKRLKLGVSNCGIWPLRISKNPFNEARTGWWTGRPALRPYLYLGKSVPVDVHELFGLIAPRPYLNITALNDVGFAKEEESLTRFCWENLDNNVQKIYALYSEKEKFANILHLDGHDFPKKMRTQAYDFIDNNLKN